MEKRCFNCMEPLSDEICQSCGYKAEQHKPAVLLKNRYFLGNEFSKGLDSSVYIAYDKELNKKVFVRLFNANGISELLQNNAQTELNQRFLSYAKTAATISLCDILPRTVDIFTEGDSAYWITDYFEGKSLKELLNSGMKISASNALKITNQLLKGLKSIHNSNMVFGAISPESVYILKNGEVRLFGIGSAFYDFTSDLDCRVELLNPSYAAPELFEQNKKVGTHTDVYSVAAILYRILVGKIPAISFLRSGGENLKAPSKINKEIPKNINIALLNALNWQTEKRTNTPEKFLAELSSKKVKRKTSSAIIWANFLGFFQAIYDKSALKRNNPPKNQETENKAERSSKKPLLWLWITIPAVVLVGLIVVLIILFSFDMGKTVDTSSVSTESEDTWYYGSGVETPNNNPSYVFGTSSDKKPTSNPQSRPQNNTSTDPNAVECPDLSGYSLEQAKAIIAQSNLLLGTISYEYSNDYPEDFVMAQNLKGGGMVQKGSKINLVVCKGAKPLSLPDVSGMQMQKATEKLNSLGFSNLEYNFVLSDSASGTVTNVAFENGFATSYESKVIITISGEKAEVLDYLDKTVAEIKNLATDFIFEFKTPNGNTLPENADFNNYTVVSQSVKKGMPAYKGMTIVITVVSFND